jgi:hypothetical protein
MEGPVVTWQLLHGDVGGSLEEKVRRRPPGAKASSRKRNVMTTHSTRVHGPRPRRPWCMAKLTDKPTVLVGRRQNIAYRIRD